MTSAAIRTIRKLDDLPEVKTVKGVRIEKGVPIPGTHANYGKWKKVLMAMEVSTVILWCRFSRGSAMGASPPLMDWT